MNEADTCRTLVRPKLEAVGWDEIKHFYSEQTPFTDGRIIVPAGKPRRLKKRLSDFLLRYTRDITLAVVEAKSDSRPAGTGLQQAKDYADSLGLKFAYATNGTDIIECDYFTGQEREVERFPTPVELSFRYQQGQGLSEAIAHARLVPDFYNPKKVPRYYQRIAIYQAIARDERQPGLHREYSPDFFDQFGPKARAILNELLEKYAKHGTTQFTVPDVLEVPQISTHGNVVEIAGKVSGSDGLMVAVPQLQALLYAA